MGIGKTAGETLGDAYGVAGRGKDAEAVFSQLMGRSNKQYVSPFYVAIVYAGQSENDKAIDWLEKAYQDRSNGVVSIQVDPQIDGLRATPCFQDFLRRLTLQK